MITVILGDTIDINEIEIIETMVKIEGFSEEEAKLTYQARKRLPNSAFCGPNRSYPAHDARNVKAGLQRLFQFRGSIKPVTRMGIYRCLSRRAKRMGIEISDDIQKNLDNKVSESEENDILDWYLNTILPEYKERYK